MEEISSILSIDFKLKQISKIIGVLLKSLGFIFIFEKGHKSHSVSCAEDLYQWKHEANK